MSEQDRLFKTIYELKFQVIFIQGLVDRCETMERRIRIFLAVASSASIAAWAIWTDLAVIWACVIALSQVLSAIHPHLPFAARQQRYSLVLRELELLFIDSEWQWHKVVAGELSLNKIRGVCHGIKLKKKATLDKFMPAEGFESDAGLARNSEEEASRYFSYHYQLSPE